MKRFVIVTALTLLSLVGPSNLASADIGDYLTNPGRQQAESVSCNSGHGAFGIFRGERGAWIPAEAQQGGIGDTTGPANSGAAASCQAQ